MTRCSGKGSGFEREICKALGLWWTEGERDDIFWRSATSGARATVRQRSGQSTFGQYGDVQASDPIGQPLIDLCTIELKRGYQQDTIGDVLDATKMNKPVWNQWLEQTLRSAREAGSFGWLLITKRNRRDTIVFIPWRLYTSLNNNGARLTRARPSLQLILRRKKNEKERKRVTVFGTTFSEFIRLVNRRHVERTVGFIR